MFISSRSDPKPHRSPAQGEEDKGGYSHFRSLSDGGPVRMKQPFPESLRWWPVTGVYQMDLQTESEHTTSVATHNAHMDLEMESQHTTSC